MAGRHSSQSGFTLVEMLVALAIFALLSAAGVAMLRSSIVSQSAVESRLVQIGGMSRLHSLLESDLAQAVDRPTRGPAGDRPAFAGDAQGMEFVRGGWANLDEGPRPDLQRVQWRLAEGALGRTGFLSLDGGGEGSTTAPLARRLASGQLRYRAADGSWAGSFRSSEQAPLPTAVELTVAPADGSAAVVMVFALSQAVQPQAAAQ